MEHLVRSGKDVSVLVQYNSFGSIGWLQDLDAAVRSEIEIHHGDVRDAEHISNLIAGVDEVFHLAALIAIPYSYVAPRSYVETNVGGTLNVLEAAKRHATARVLITSTSEVYGTAQYAPIDEAHPLHGQSPYSASKIAADKLAEAYYRSFGTPVVTVRPFNTFGPRQSRRALIPTIIAQLASRHGGALSLGDLTPTRDFNYVEDVVRGFEALAQSDQAVGMVVNLATGNEWSVLDAVREISTIMGVQISEDEIVESADRVRPKDSEVFRLIGSSRLAHDLTGWEPRIDFRTGIGRTVQWFRSRNPSDSDASNKFVL